MQLALEKSLSSIDMSRLAIGVNKVTQSPQDHILNYSQGSQTDTILMHDVSADTRKISLNSSIQCINESLEMYTQTEIMFMKNKNVQACLLGINNFTQTEKQKLRHAIVQTATKLFTNKCLQATGNSINFKDASTETEIKSVSDKEVVIDNIDRHQYITKLSAVNESNNLDINETITRLKEKSDSPPLAAEKEEIKEHSSVFSLPFVSIFNPMAIKMPTLGISYVSICVCLFT